MATADYRLCDVCDGKTFYDAHLNYEQGRASEWAKRQAPFRWAGEEQGKPEHDDYLLRLDYLGDWAVICSNCAKTHKTTVVPIESAPDEPIADSDADYWLRNRQAILDAIERAGFMLMSNASGFWLHPRGKIDAQAEQKREPLSDERIDEIGDPFGYFQYGDAQGDKRRAFARAVERAAYERAAQECEAQISGSDHHYLATHGHWDHMAQAATNCAAAIRALGRQQ